jgi:pyridoxine kinase
MLSQPPVKQIAAIHDLSGCGRTSLSVVIPILSAMGIKVCPLPTAVLSSHSRYEGYHFADLTDHMQPVIDHWKKLNVFLTRFTADSWVRIGKSVSFRG